jgi:beta-glucanase (GH16 family)
MIAVTRSPSIFACAGFILLVTTLLTACAVPPSTPASVGDPAKRPTAALDTKTPIPVPTKTKTPTDTPTPVPMPQGLSGNWRLVFSDEFDGHTLDSSKWATCWSYGCGTTDPSLWYSAANVVAGNGIIQLRADNQSHRQRGNDFSYTTGMLSTGADSSRSQPRFTFQYGYFEARVKAPAGVGLWPAFWLLSPAQRPPEIDIMEILGIQPNRVQMHYHYLDSTGIEQDSGASWDDGDFSAGWHTFGLEWQPTSLIWYIDGVQRRVYDGSNVAAEPLYLILNLQVGGSWGGKPDATTVFPAYYDVDYVRVWQPATPYLTSTPR